MASNEKLYEEYGFKAAAKGVFEEWRAKTSSILEENPEMNRLEAAEKAYYKVIGSK